MFRPVIAGGLSLVALRTVFGLAQLKQRVTSTRAPINERLLRSPGESLRIHLEKLNEKLMLCLALFAGGPVLFSLTARGFPDTLTIALLLAVIGLSLIPFRIVVKEYRDYSLGLMGERAVGEELNQLMAEGCRVFHDYPGGPNWNIDHVVVAPSGVYAIETKMRRKRRAPKGKKDQDLTFDGVKLHFPRCISTSELEQARRNARDLSRELTSATGEPVVVKPILTLPGWYITRTGKSDVTVLNPKEIRQLVLSTAGAQLSPQQIQRVAHQVEQKCRDVVF